jgi:hypothetical protein
MRIDVTVAFARNVQHILIAFTIVDSIFRHLRKSDTRERLSLRLNLERRFCRCERTCT